MLLVLVAFFAYNTFMQNNDATTPIAVTNQQLITDSATSSDESEDASVVSEDTEADDDALASSDPCQDLKDNIPNSANFVITTNIADGITITSGDTLSGCIYAPNGTYGNWAPFEGQIGSYQVLSGTGDVLGSGPIPVVPVDWMTPAMAGDDIEYNTTMTFDATGYTSGSIILRNENASGDPATEELIVVTVNF